MQEVHGRSFHPGEDIFPWTFHPACVGMISDTPPALLPTHGHVPSIHSTTTAGEGWGSIWYWCHWFLQHLVIKLKASFPFHKAKHWVSVLYLKCMLRLLCSWLRYPGQQARTRHSSNFSKQTQRWWDWDKPWCTSLVCVVRLTVRRRKVNWKNKTNENISLTFLSYRNIQSPVRSIRSSLCLFVCGSYTIIDIIRSCWNPTKIAFNGQQLNNKR